MRQKDVNFQKRTGEVIENKGSGEKTNRKSAKNEAEKLLKTLECIKNELGHVVENTWQPQSEPKEVIRKFPLVRHPIRGYMACWACKAAPSGVARRQLRLNPS